MREVQQTANAARPDIEILDTTLRDGAQGEGIVFSVRDKLGVAEALDELGVSWIEAGNPGSNPKDLEFFQLASLLKLQNAKLCAFGPTRKKGLKAKDDAGLRSLLDAETEGVTVFGKSWDLHVTDVIQVEPEENIAMIAETVAFLKAEGRIVIFDAEHFFDGWAANAAYALSAVKAALEAGADRIVLCDTNGGAFPNAIADGVRAVKESVPAAFTGIHAHNDSGLALANTISAVQAGCTHVQGTLVGFGERCGNTALAALIPSLELKLKLRCLPDDRLIRVSALTRRVAEIANVSISDDMPYVGAHAFSHKAGMHTDGILKVRRSFEHIEPAAVGNNRHFLMSEVVGRSAIAERTKELDPSITKDHPVTIALAEKIKNLEAKGWAFEGADASFELLVRRELGRYKPLFRIEAYRVMSEHPTGETISCSHAWVKILVEGQHEIAAAEGNGPVNALDGALRRALLCFYPNLAKVRLEDYKVRVIDGKEATAAKVRVLIESTDGQRTWNTVGVSADIIDASRAALVDSIEYKLIGDIENSRNVFNEGEIT
ncbi:MAG: citramalate synthase [Treponema sp.]|jgi:2-isopropylmalate synthase|nr:citramalate synthase [Treponema sp.]